MQASKDHVVSIDYKLTSDEGQVLDQSQPGQPLSYLHGRGNIIPGLEQAIEGKAAGESLSITVPPAEGYGERNDGLRQEVPRQQFQGVDDLAVGMRFRVPTNAGDIVVTVIEVRDDTVVIDGNHQLAGETLHFDVEVVDVREASDEELAHGHAHGPGGQSH